MIQDKYNKDTLHDIVYDAIGFDANNYQLEVLFSNLPRDIVGSIDTWGIRDTLVRESIFMFARGAEKFIINIPTVSGFKGRTNES